MGKNIAHLRGKLVFFYLPDQTSILTTLLFFLTFDSLQLHR